MPALTDPATGELRPLLALQTKIRLKKEMHPVKAILVRSETQMKPEPSATFVTRNT